MKKEKIMLGKKQLNEIEKFMIKHEIQEYRHQQNNLNVVIKYPKENESNTPKKLIFVCLAGIILCVVFPNFMDDFYNFQLWTNAITVLEMAHSHFIKKDKLITVYDIVKKTKDYYDSTEQTNKTMEVK